MSSILTVNVTQYHIDMGIPSECGACPIYHALCSASGHFQWAVFKFNISNLDISNGLGKRRRWVTPEIAMLFIYAFDERKFEFVKPFSFELDLSKEY